MGFSYGKEVAMKIDVLDKGYIEKMMCADSDLTVVNCARVSFGKESDWERYSETLCDDWEGIKRGKRLSDRDTKLIHYLAREGHWSPFAHPQIRLRFHAPVSIARQLFKHRFGGDPNEVSRRYVKDDPEVHSPSAWRSRPEGSIKQGSGALFDSPKLQEEYDRLTRQCLDLYNRMVADAKDGGVEVAQEQARFVLPQGTYTTWIWTGSLAFFARVYNQRSHDTAQWEAREYAAALDEIMRPLFPVSWEALTGGVRG